jgi:transposase-like protein
MKRFQSRRGNGRFQRNTLENTFGLTVQTCPHCRTFNPRSVGEPKRETCHACGKPLDEPVSGVAERTETEEGANG